MTLALVGIGASAGGLEAVRQLLAHLPSTGRAAYIIAQHQPGDGDTQKMVELVRFDCPLPVQVARPGETLVPDRVYWIPAGQDGRVRGTLLELTPASSLSRPSVDTLLQSLAGQVGECSLAVILSGAGSDGVAGCRAIQAAGGLTLAQAPELARFPGMPRAAIEAGAVDRVLPADQMGAIIAGRLSRPAASSGLAALLEQVLQATGVDFRGYKQETLLRRLDRRLSALKLKGLKPYLDLIQRQPGELSHLQQEFLVSLSGFFRDQECFGALEAELRRDLARLKRPIRIWVPACATGEEAYSLAMLLVEMLGAEAAVSQCWLSACDLSEEALAVARRGIYSSQALELVPPARRERYFYSTGKGYQVSELLRSMVRFTRQDVLTGPIPEHLDLISCRNLLIYLQPGPQGELLQAFSRGLKPGGLLFLAPSETAGPLGARLFAPVHKQHRLYRRRGALAS
ncbi:chemotaxis protein [bacterium]|nr:chemotaxis protein [bacterium]